MRLPNCYRAVVDPAKLIEHCLNPDHPRGRHKARVFRSALGITADDAEVPTTAIRNAAGTEDALPGLVDEYGTRFSVDFTLSHEGMTARVRSA